VGALTLLLSEEILKALTDHWMAVLGPLIVLVVLLTAKRGLYGFLLDWDAARERRERLWSTGAGPGGQVMAQPTLKIIDLVKRYGGLLATDHVSMSLMPGELHAIIGPNGAGKSTLIGQLGGEVRPDSGRIEFAGQDISALPPAKRALKGLARSLPDHFSFQRIHGAAKRDACHAGPPGPQLWFLDAHAQASLTGAARLACH
jgi:hypothetical protein